MIIFDRFLCCIKLKLFGKLFGWIGTCFSIMSAYAIFLIACGRKSAGENVSKPKHMIYGNDLSAEGEVKGHTIFFGIYKYIFCYQTDFYYYTALVIGLLLIIAAVHILLICGIKYVSIRKIIGKCFIALLTFI